MRPFVYIRVDDATGAIQAALAQPVSPGAASTQFLAGGTTLIDLMKLDVMRPARVVDINGLSPQLARIDSSAEGLRMGALVRMGEAAEHPEILRDYPVIAQSLGLAASQQVRNMATLGGNVLQRTRCSYFRDASYTACNKRVPGSGCAAIGGNTRKHAVLGTSEHCIALYPGDFAQALVALGAKVEIVGPNGARQIPFEELHRPPGNTPHIETSLDTGDLITGFVIPSGPWTRRSLYLKIRDRESFEFALASSAVALDLTDGVVKQARIALGGMASKPWRSRTAEEALRGRFLDEAAARAAAELAFAEAESRGDNEFKPELGRRTLVRALLQARDMEV
jgi:xanthine dehydrogenase YagS FAD-binding subunit